VRLFADAAALTALPLAGAAEVAEIPTDRVTAAKAAKMMMRMLPS